MPNLFQWSIVDKNPEYDGKPVLQGVVTDHPYIDDAAYIMSTEIRNLEIQGTDVIVDTNTRYICSLKDADYDAFTMPQLIPNFEKEKEKYQKKETKETKMNDNSILLILGSNRRIFFDSIHSKYNGEVVSSIEHSIMYGIREPVVHSRIELGSESVDFSYYSNEGRNVVFRTWPKEKDVYIENCGVKPLYVTLNYVHHTIKPGGREKIVYVEQEWD